METQQKWPSTLRKRPSNEPSEEGGEVWLANWNPSRGSEQAGIRPALVIQNDIGNEKSSTTIVDAISGNVKIYPMNVKIEAGESGLDKPSIVKTSQILTVSRERLMKKIVKANHNTMHSVNTAIKLSLDID
jgi:mRNA interferase MazF